jgi:Cys-rich protein (TIGR01571 family)
MMQDDYKLHESEKIQVVQVRQPNTASIMINDSVLVPEGKWNDNIYDCFNNLPICCMGWCCGCIQVSQMYEKVVGPRGIYKRILCTFFSLYLILWAAGSLYNQTQNKSYLALYRVIGFIAGTYSLVLMTTIRKRIRNHYNIPETTCTGCEDVCCSFFCPACSSCQNARQIYTRPSHSTNGECIFTPTGDSGSEVEYLFEQQPTTWEASSI